MNYTEVIEKHKQEWDFEEISFEEYYEAVNGILEKVKFFPTAEQLDFLLEYKTEILLVDSTAGAGKTTASVIKSIIDEEVWGIDPYDILFLTFSKRSAEDMKYKRTQLMNRFFNKRNLARLSTMHSLCYSMLTSFYKEAGLIMFDESRIIQDELVSISELTESLSDIQGDYDEEDEYGFEYDDGQGDDFGNMGVTIVDILKRFIEPNKDLEYINTFNEMRNIMSAMAYQKERMLTDQEMGKERIFEGMECSLPHYIKLKADVEHYKSLMGYLDFTDMQTYCLKLFRESKDILKDNKTFLKVFNPSKIYIDEFQDMTPLQKELIKEILNFESRDGKVSSLICIGDGDQSIYGFRGADTLEFEDFQNTFDPIKENSALKVFTVNHRCGSKIIDVASPLINNNVLRNPKIIKSIEREGKFNIKTYSNTKDQVRQVLREIEEIRKEEGEEVLDEIAIIYREHSQALGLVTMFLRRDIPFNLRGRKLPFDHWIFRNTLELCESLLFADVPDHFDSIYKFTPINKNGIQSLKDEYFETIKKQTETVTWIDILERRNNDKNSKQRIDPKLITEYRRLSKALNTKGEPIKPIIERVYSMYQLHNLNYVLDKLISVDRSEIESIELFMDNIPGEEDFDQLLYNIREWEGYLTRTRLLQEGVKLLSMHATKGLEFERVYVIGVDSNYTPKESYAKELNERNRLEYIESERRLLYVGITRAIKECTVYASITHPSLFLPELDGEYTKFVKSSVVGEEHEKAKLEPYNLLEYTPQNIKEGINWTIKRYVEPYQ